MYPKIFNYFLRKKSLIAVSAAAADVFLIFRCALSKQNNYLHKRACTSETKFLPCNICTIGQSFMAGTPQLFGRFQLNTRRLLSITTFFKF